MSDETKTNRARKQKSSHPESSDLCLRINEPEKKNNDIKDPLLHREKKWAIQHVLMCNFLAKTWKHEATQQGAVIAASSLKSVWYVWAFTYFKRCSIYRTLLGLRVHGHTPGSCLLKSKCLHKICLLSRLTTMGRPSAHWVECGPHVD